MSLDPKTNRREREAEKAKQRAEEPPLNPPFPHKRQSFDPFFCPLSTKLHPFRDIFGLKHLQ